MDLEQVIEMSKRVANEHGALERAKSDKALAEDKLLTMVVDAIRPALPAMCSRTPEKWECAGPIARAVRVIAENGGVPWLYLGEQGDWFAINASERVCVLSTNEVLDMFDVVTVIVSLVASLRQQIGAREKSTSKIRDEVVRLEALATLLAPVPR